MQHAPRLLLSAFLLGAPSGPLRAAAPETESAPAETVHQDGGAREAAEHPAAAPAAGPANRGGVIVHGGRVVVVPPGPSRAHRPRAHSRREIFIAPAAPVPSPSAAPSAAGTDEEARTAAHARAAEAHAYQHFRYKYKVGSAHYAVTSLNIVLEETEEVPGWSRFRSVGEAGIEYSDGATFRRAVRRFEVLTEERKGRPVAIDIEVRF